MIKPLNYPWSEWRKKFVSRFTKRISFSSRVEILENPQIDTIQGDLAADIQALTLEPLDEDFIDSHNLYDYSAFSEFVSLLPFPNKAKVSCLYCYVVTGFTGSLNMVELIRFQECDFIAHTIDGMCIGLYKIKPLLEKNYLADVACLLIFLERGSFKLATIDKASLVLNRRISRKRFHDNLTALIINNIDKSQGNCFKLRNMEEPKDIIGTNLHDTRFTKNEKEIIKKFSQTGQVVSDDVKEFASAWLKLKYKK